MNALAQQLLEEMAPPPYFEEAGPPPQPERRIDMQAAVEKVLGDDLPGLVNNGGCEEFAIDLQRLAGGTIMATTEAGGSLASASPFWAHFFLYHGGRYYDAEHPRGTEKPEDLFWR